MSRSHKPSIIEVLEKLVDEVGVNEVLTQLADVCAKKADQLLSTRQKRTEVRWWVMVEGIVEDAKDKIEELG